MTEEQKDRLGRSMRGKTYEELYGVEMAEKLKSQKRGINNPSWRGGLLKRTETTEWKDICKQVMLRDRFTCRRCKKNKKILAVHHIIPYLISQNDNIDNLISLCKSCHMKVERRIDREVYARIDSKGVIRTHNGDLIKYIKDNYTLYEIKFITCLTKEINEYELKLIESHSQDIILREQVGRNNSEQEDVSVSPCLPEMMEESEDKGESSEPLPFWITKYLDETKEYRQ